MPFRALAGSCESRYQVRSATVAPCDRPHPDPLQLRSAGEGVHPAIVASRGKEQSKSQKTMDSAPGLLVAARVDDPPGAFKQADDFIIVDLMKVVVENADGSKQLWHRQTDHLVDLGS
ncbi:MAG: hypothetical protein QOK29_1749 [Rhodospirillaceae bacterium]|nr:hypothetical protein [Rhodospirillaceae bacterium]